MIYDCRFDLKFHPKSRDKRTVFTAIDLRISVNDLEKMYE